MKRKGREVEIPLSLLEELPKDVLVSRILYYLPPSSCVFISRCSKALHFKTHVYCRNLVPSALVAEYHLFGLQYIRWAISLDDPWLLVFYIERNRLLDRVDIMKLFAMETMELCAFNKKPPYDVLYFLENLLE